jgi:hypothetical protein
VTDKFELRAADGTVVWTGEDRKAIKSLDLAEGDYKLWKLAGNFTVKVVPARATVAFDSAAKKGPRGAKESAEAPAEEPAEGRGLLSRLRG